MALSHDELLELARIVDEGVSSEAVRVFQDREGFLRRVQEARAVLDSLESRLKPPIPVVNVVCHSAGEVLLGKRVGGDAAGIWCTPGGKADTPGSLAEHACREVAEEIGVALAPGDLFELPVWDEHVAESGQNFICGYYAAREPLLRSEIRLMEPDKFEYWSFWSPDKLPQRMFKGDRRAVHAFASLGLL